MPTKHYTNWLGGYQSASTPFTTGDNELVAGSNVDTTYKLGAILKALGYSQIGSTLEASKSILGLHNFRQSSTTQKMLATVDDSGSNDTQLFYSTGGAWTEITGAETAWANYAGINVEMEDFIGYCFFVGWGSTDGFLPVASLTGTTFSTSTNVTNMPTGKFIKRYRDRLYVANLNDGGALPYRVAISDLPSGATLGWTEYQADTGLIDVDYSEEITGLGENWDKLLIFTEYSTYAYNQDEKKKVWDVGCSNHRTIKNSGASMFWANRDGVWESTGGRPNNIAGKVIDFIKFTDMTGAFAEVVDEKYYLFVGTTTVNGISYTNTTLIYDIPTQTWLPPREFASDTPTIFAKFYSSGDDILYMGMADGEVMKQSKYTDTTPIYADDGNDLHAFFQTKAFDLGDPSVKKRIKNIVAYSDRNVGLKLKARILNNNVRAITPFKPLTDVKGYIGKYTVNPDRGHFIQFEGVETGQLPYWSFFGFSVDVEDDTKLK